MNLHNIDYVIQRVVLTPQLCHLSLSHFYHFRGEKVREMMLQKDINQRARVTIQTPFLAAFLRFLESAIAALLQGEKNAAHN